MVESIYFLKPAWCGIHPAGLWPEQGLQPVTTATAFEAVDFTFEDQLQTFSRGSDRVGCVGLTGPIRGVTSGLDVCWPRRLSRNNCSICDVARAVADIAA